MPEKAFRGTYTAMITPFKEDGKIDYSSVYKILSAQIFGGVDGVLVCGTSGESPTLSHKEHSELIRRCVDYVHGSIKVIAGTGSNCTREAIELSKKAQDDGADAILLVNPYYNKPTQEGLFLHFRAISDSIARMPVILYNIKGRTGVNLETSTLCRIVNECGNVVGVKEASGDLNQIQGVIESKLPSYFSVLSGDDNLTSAVLKLGGTGVISVLSNLFPKGVSNLVDCGLEGRFDDAEKINARLSRLFQLCFIETNPIPIKYMMSKENFCKEIYRLPLCELRPVSKKIIDEYFSRNVSRN